MDIQIIINTAVGPQEVAKFVEALKWLGSPVEVPVQQPAVQPVAAPVPITATFAAVQAPVQQPVPVITPPAPVQQQQPAPAYIPPQVPVAPTTSAAPQTQPPAAVPTAAPEYTHEQIGRAVAAFIDKAPANREKVLSALNGLGCQSITQLDTPAKRGTYVNALRILGVQI